MTAAGGNPDPRRPIKVGQRHEIVGVSTKPAAARPAAKVRFAVDVEEVRTRTQATKRDYPKWYFEVPRVQNGIFPTDRQAPSKMVSGRVWSPGIYWALRLLGKTLDVAWERAFICPLTSN